MRAADPAARRHALLFVVAGTVVGVALIAGIEHYRVWLRDWLLAEPGATALRIKVVFRLFAALVWAPLLGFAAYLWSLGVKVLRAKEFPPPGYRVIRDTPVITGAAAVSRGRRIKTLALGCAIASALLGILLWRLV